MTDADQHIRILHLSDIHLGNIAQAQRYFTQLATDLTQNLNVKQLNYLVISGDIANRSTEEEYEAAFELVDKLVKRYGLDPNRIVIVPGNHDLNWDLSEAAYNFFPQRKLPNPLPEGRYIRAGDAGALIRDEEEYKKRFDYFSDRFYKKIYNQPYPQEYSKQAVLYPCPQDKILFLGLNSCWEIDHEHKDRASINPDAIAYAIEQIFADNYDDWLKIAIWHHPVNSSESMKNVAFLEQLAVNGFQLGIHGHIHEAKDEHFRYDHRRGLRIIAAGTFGAPTKEQVTGIPLQYNLLTLNPETGVMTVETRKKEKVDGAWSADARWGDKNNPVPRYEIPLIYGTGKKTDNSSSQSQASSQDNRPNVSQSIFGGNVKVGRDINIGSINYNNQPTTTNPTDNPPPKRKILILASSPIDKARLRLDAEVREIDEGLRRAQKREQFTLEQKWAVRPDDLRRALLDLNPQIVHFSGHGKGEKGILLENDKGEAQLVPTNALTNLFKLFASRGVECVVLNACYAEVQAKAISEHINYVVGMSDEISDRAAVKFAVGFYDALGAGWSYEDAFDMGCSAIALEGIPEELTPVLKKKTNKKKDHLTSRDFVEASTVKISNPDGDISPFPNRECKKVFISYRSEDPDLSLAQNFYDAIANAGHQAFMAGESIHLGENWAQRIDRELKSCDYFLLFLSSKSATSEMVTEEVRRAKQLQDLRSENKPVILPIRVNFPFSSPLNYDLRGYLNQIQQREWKSSADTTKILQEVLRLLAGENQDTIYLAPTEESFATQYVAESLENPPLPVAEPELPEGQVDLASAFYVSRDRIEERCFEAIIKPGSLIRIKAPRQMGKTSLMARILHHASQNDCLTVPLSFQLADGKVFADLDQFLRWFSVSVGRRLKLSNKLTDYWDEIFGSKDNCTAYFEEYLLTQINQPLVLGLDEVDLVFQHREIANDFFGLLRAWHEDGKNRDIWKKLRLVVVHSTEVYIPMNINQSPFNVGLPIELSEFNQEQIQDLAQRHGLNWDGKEIEELMTMVGGHPFLVRVAMYHIARQDTTLNELLQTAPTEAGLYGDHLRRHLWNLEQRPDLATAFKNIVTTITPARLNSIQCFQLLSMGLVHLQDNDVTPRCYLYRQYFRDRL